jgi:hypothetical protein
MKRMLGHGALAGAIGGLVSALFLRLVGERSIDTAVGIEHATTGAHDEMFSRSTQHLGGMIGVTLAGIAFGVLLAALFSRLRHRLPGGADWQRALWLGAMVWVTANLVPALKYPPNPPTVGDPDTIDQRTVAYLLLLLFSILAVVTATFVASWARRRGLDDQLRLLASVGTFVVLVGVALLVFPPTPDAVHAPTQLVWRFRLQSLGGTAILWLTTATVLGRLVTAPSKARV